MGIIDRILLLLHALALAFLSLVALALCAQHVSFNFVWTNFLYLTGRWETAASFAVLLLISLRLLRVSLSFGKSRRDKSLAEAVVVHGNIGDVQVTVSAIRDLVERTARSVRGVRDVKLDVIAPRPAGANAPDAPINVRIKIVVGQEVRVTEITDQVRDLVKRTLTDIVGLGAVAIDVMIDGISNTNVQKQRVV